MPFFALPFWGGLGGASKSKVYEKNYFINRNCVV
jgi:hypothetical protein